MYYPVCGIGYIKQYLASNWGERYPMHGVGEFPLGGAV